MLDYKTIITQHYALHMSGRVIASGLGVSKSGVNDFLNAFKACKTLRYPLPNGITNYGIYEQVYGQSSAPASRRDGFTAPDYSSVNSEMSRKNMTLVFLWGRYKNQCIADGSQFYSYRQFCAKYSEWLEANNETMHFNTVAGEKIEVDFAGKTFEQVDKLTGEVTTIVVFVAVLPYSQYIYAEGMLSTKEPEWITVNNHMLRFFGGVTPLVICDNCKQAVVANKDWIEPDLNKDYAEWADHNGTVIMPARVRKPRYKSSVENSVGILEKGFFHELEDMIFFSIEDFNSILVSSDFHVRFDNAYYSVPHQYVHKPVLIAATTSLVTISARSGEKLCEWPRAKYKGQWQTNPDHLPAGYKGTMEWNGPYFKQKAAAIGPYTEDVINHVLASRKYEVQSYRQCIGILGFAKKYSRKVLEACCRQAVSTGRANYTFIKNSIPGIAAEVMSPADTAKVNEEKNQGAYLRDASASSIDSLLAKSRNLMEQEGGSADE